MKALGVCFAVLYASVAMVCATEIRGVSKEMQSKYVSQKGIFTCLDGSVKLPFSAVNDDYCDCRDGSDEPGTSACSNGHFFCENKGYLSKTVFSSRVNDGICDCCDGSDEYLGRTSCANDCFAMGAELRKAAEERAKVYQEGLSKRAAFAAQGHEAVQRWSVELENLKVKLEEKKKVTEELQAIKSAAEEKERLEREQKEAERKAKEEEEEKLKAETVATPTPPHEVIEEVPADIKTEQQPEGEGGDKPVISEYAKWSETPVEKDSHDEDESSGEPGHEQHHEELGAPVEKSAVEQEAESARAAHSKAAAEESEVESQIQKLEKNLALDLGEEKEYYPLVGQCFSVRQDKYTYELCPFEGVTQKEGGSSTSLGKWNAWQEDRRKMSYTGGQSCWQGPARSCLVSIECGAENVVKKVEEPSRCVYSMVFETPAACHPELVEKTTASHVVKDEL
eukprot:GILJ01006262.1.p1 GENE.GILJ01006262.1~~GILJ01006262.1.p1  ORF type:complete len:466 (-),score=100.81 GILJ01006262.1:73-1428(-)